tara:strand:- start:1635 stop:2003 length:369 start_codon:yes stop_codon:yes gene_type:complete
MRSTIYGTLITTFLVTAGTAQAANDLDGKALFCFGADRFGITFTDGKATKWIVKGYEKKKEYVKSYELIGTDKVQWKILSIPRTLNRETLVFEGRQCQLSTKLDIFSSLDEIIEQAKKKNKL